MADLGDSIPMGAAVKREGQGGCWCWVGGGGGAGVGDRWEEAVRGGRVAQGGGGADAAVGRRRREGPAGEVASCGEEDVYLGSGDGRTQNE